MSDRIDSGMRRDLEAWEAAAAAYWDSLTRSPDVLLRIGHHLHRNLETQQHVTDAVRKAMAQTAGDPQQVTQVGEQLHQLAERVEALAARIDALSVLVDHDC